MFFRTIFNSEYETWNGKDFIAKANGRSGRGGEARVDRSCVTATHACEHTRTMPMQCQPIGRITPGRLMHTHADAHREHIAVSSVVAAAAVVVAVVSFCLPTSQKARRTVSFVVVVVVGMVV